MSTNHGGNDCRTTSQFKKDTLVTLQEGEFQLFRD